MAQSPSDGKWRALDGEPILRGYRLAAGYLYQAQLRAELTRSLGVEWEQPRKGMAELRQVPREGSASSRPGGRRWSRSSPQGWRRLLRGSARGG